MIQHLKTALFLCLSLSIATPAYGADSASASSATASASNLKVLDPGTGKKQIYKYSFKPQQTYQIEMDLTLQVDISDGENPRPPQRLPIMRISMEVKTGNLQPKGNIKAIYTFTGSKVIANTPSEQQIAGVIAAELEDMKGLTGTGLLAPDGRVDSIKYTLPSDAKGPLPQVFQNIQHTMNQVSTTLPEVPIGIGAQWEINADLNADGISLNQKTRYTLLSVKGNKLKLRAKLTQVAPKQTIEKPQLPKELKVTLESFNGEGSGDLTIDLTAPVSESFSTLKIKTKMTATHLETTQTINSVLSTQSEIRRLKP